MDFSLPGWKVRHGQAVWKPAGADEVAGELLVATRTDGSALVQFSKPPITLVTAQRTAEQWEVHFPPNHQMSGSGPAPERMIWLHLVEYLEGAPPSTTWSWERPDHQSWRLQNRRTGESLEGYLTP